MASLFRLQAFQSPFHFSFIAFMRENAFIKSWHLTWCAFYFSGGTKSLDLKKYVKTKESKMVVVAFHDIKTDPSCPVGCFWPAHAANWTNTPLL